MKNLALYIVIICSLCSCETQRYFSINVRKPASVTFPTDVKNIVLIDNSPQETNDSINVFLMDALSQFVAEDNYFEKIAIYDRLENERLNKAKLMQICDSTQADAFLLVNIQPMRLVEGKGTLVLNGYQLRIDSITAFTKVDLSVFGKSGNVISMPISTSDSLFWVQMKLNDGEVITPPLPSNDEIRKEIAELHATKLEQKLVPHWNIEDRKYYSSGKTQMQRAAIYAQAEKWEDAMDLWKQIFDEDKTKNPQLAFNIALAYEMVDDLENALLWIKESERLAVTPKHQKSTTEEDIKIYKSIIEQRINDFKVLDLQEN